jgi:hypothetical protein
MAKVIPITERFQHLVAELQESLGRSVRADAASVEKFFEMESERLRDRYAGGRPMGEDSESQAGIERILLARPSGPSSR